MKKEIIALREKMKENSLDCYIVPTGDFHGSEYINDYFKTRTFLSGFTGSAGTMVVTMDEARLWVDSRYYLQGEMQLEGSGIILMKDGLDDVIDLEDYLKEVLSPGKVLGFDGRVVTGRLGQLWADISKEAGAETNPHLDLVGQIWDDRPALQGKEIWALDYTKEFSTEEDPLYPLNIKRVREAMAKEGADYYLVADLMENAYLYGLRGNDVDDTPVFFSYSLIGPEDTTLYIFRDDAPIPEGVKVKNYFDVEEDLKALPNGLKILMDPSTVSYGLIKSIPQGVETLLIASPLSMMKAIKSPVEINSTEKLAHVYDGIAMAEFIYWMKEEMKSTIASGASQSSHTEISASNYLAARRESKPGYIEPSFATIAGYGPHGAIVHYKATPESDIHLEPKGFFLVDSGGQYLTGTTDITRTIAMGPLTEEMKLVYTAILKAHITMATATFPAGTTGSQLDTMVRDALGAYGYQYGHGTGHGVGFVLGVHEGPQSVSTKGTTVPILPGMVMSNEPGYYIEDGFGARIENLIYCVDEGDCYSFRNLTLCPYEKEAIIKDELTPEEIAYVDSYHAKVYETIAPYLDEEVRSWLEKECSPL